MRVTRAEVVLAAERAIQSSDASPNLKDGLMQVARTAPRLAVNWEAEGCGCLVGTYRLHLGLSAQPAYDDEVEGLIGNEFPKFLLGSRWTLSCGDVTIFTVIDDEQEEVQGMDIGKEERTIIVEPMKNPVPQKEPVPAKEPVKTPEREPAKTP